MIGIKLAGDWASTKKKIDATAAKVEPAIAKNLRAEGEYLAGVMRKRFDKVRPANARTTKLLKGSSKPLVEQADLRNSIGVVEGADPLEILIGIPASADREVRLATIHEEGAIIVQQMTAKQRRWMFANLPKQDKVDDKDDGPSTGIIVIHIPARPFIGPTFEQEADRSAKRFMRAMIRDLEAT